MEQKKQFGVIFFLIDQERIEKVGHFYRKLRYSQMHSNPGATLKILVISLVCLIISVVIILPIFRIQFEIRSGPNTDKFDLELIASLIILSL